jgi:hypothetical protein
VHEIKHDGFRMMVRRDAAGVRLLDPQRQQLDGPLPAHRCGGWRAQGAVVPNRRSDELDDGDNMI